MSILYLLYTVINSCFSQVSDVSSVCLVLLDYRAYIFLTSTFLSVISNWLNVSTMTLSGYGMHLISSPYSLMINLHSMTRSEDTRVVSYTRFLWSVYISILYPNKIVLNSFSVSINWTVWYLNIGGKTIMSTSIVSK